MNIKHVDSFVYFAKSIFIKVLQRNGVNSLREQKVLTVKVLWVKNKHTSIMRMRLIHYSHA